MKFCKVVQQLGEDWDCVGRNHHKSMHGLQNIKAMGWKSRDKKRRETEDPWTGEAVQRRLQSIEQDDSEVYGC